MYYGCKWEVLSGVCTILLAAFVVVNPLQQDAYWWRIIVGLLAFAAIFALHRALKSERIPRPHELRVHVQEFICDLSEAKHVDENLITRAMELEQAFQSEGILLQYFPRLTETATLETLNRAAVCFQAMLNMLPTGR
jgi:hypothetical protein